MENQFFKPTPLFKEFMILDLVSKDANITQRALSARLHVSVSMINAYLDEYEKMGYIKRKYLSTKSVEYNITKKGIERKKVLNIGYLNAAQGIYASAKSNIEVFLNQIIEKGFKTILLYGAGEVAEILLHVIRDGHAGPIEVLAVIDDDVSKKGKTIVNRPIILNNQINKFAHDGILISSYTHHKQISDRLMSCQYKKNKIIDFFDN